jgi:hypothetical protein
VPQSQSELEFFDLALDLMVIVGFDGNYKRPMRAIQQALLALSTPPRKPLAGGSLRDPGRLRCLLGAGASQPPASREARMNNVPRNYS